MVAIHDVPIDALAATFAYLNAKESISCRGVCKKWSKLAGKGALIVRVRPPPTPTVMPKNIGSVTLCGRVQQMPTDEINKSAHDERKPAAAENRTRGHLPKTVAPTPSGRENAKITFATDRLRDCEYQSNRTEALEAGNILSMKTGGTGWSSWYGAIQVEHLPSPLITLDLSSSSSRFEYSWRARGASGFFDEIVKPRKPRILRNFLEELDLSGLQHLRELSVRGCGNLQSLNLPPSLHSLDAGGCSELIRVDFPNGVDGNLRSLDLGGCRRLREREYRVYRPRPGLLGPNTISALRNVVNLDVSQVIQNLALDFCFALSSTVSLEMISLRYAATDEVLNALAESQSATSGSLRLVDIAFSTKVTGEAVELLARSAPKLERLNMRGCKKIATSCYNYIPVYLERRRQGGEDWSEEDSSFRTCSRKGDNLFYFCQK